MLGPKKIFIISHNKMRILEPIVDYHWKEKFR